MMAADRPPLYSDVVLTRDFDEDGLKRGDIATFIDTVPHPHGGPEGLILEVANARGESIGIVTVTDDDIRSIDPSEIPTVRQMSKVHSIAASERP